MSFVKQWVLDLQTNEDKNSLLISTFLAVCCWYVFPPNFTDNNEILTYIQSHIFKKIRKVDIKYSMSWFFNCLNLSDLY